jgi:hypothetical protein
VRRFKFVILQKNGYNDDSSIRMAEEITGNTGDVRITDEELSKQLMKKSEKSKKNYCGWLE